MLPEFYLTSLHSQLSASQLLTLEMLVWLLQFHKQVRIERLAAELAYWLKQKKVYFALRQKPGSYIKLRGQNYQKLSELGLAPGMKLFFTGVSFTKKKGFGQFSLAAYWKRKYRGKGPDEGWYILTNLKSLDAALKVYKTRSGIEAMFKDCKSGGYNLEDSKASVERLTSLILLIALAYTCAGLQDATGG